MIRTPVSLVGFGACTSLGYAIEPTLAAMGAGLDNFRETDTPGMNDDFVIAASCYGLTPQAERGARMEALLKLAIEDFIPWLHQRVDVKVPLLAALPTGLIPAERMVIEQTLERCGHFLLPADWMFAHGRAAGFAALDAAVKMLTRGETQLVAVLGLDSLCSTSMMSDLVDARRILAPGTEGCIPGEAAIFTLLCRRDNHLAKESTALQLDHISLTRAKASFLERPASDGTALARIFHQLRRVHQGRVEYVIAAHSGEVVMGRSFSTAYLREAELMPEPLEVELTADKLGDVGAASALVGCAFAAYLSSKSSAGRPSRSLIYSESDSGELGAAIVSGRPDWRRTSLPPPQAERR